MMQLGDSLRRKPAALQANFVQHVGVGIAFGAGHGVGQHILRNRRASANVGVSADAHVLMHRAQRAHYRPLFHRHMTRQA